MKPMKPLLVLAALAFAVAAVGCSDTKVYSETGSDVGIAVSGRGEVIGEPDTGYFSVGVEVTEDTVADARESAAETLADVIDSLKDNGVDDDDLQTTNFSIYPQYNYRDNDQPRIVGFTVTNTLSVTVRDLDSFSDTLDAAIEAGGDDVRLNSIRFDRDDKEDLIRQAREQAMEDAREKAEQLADLGDVDLGEPLSIVESSSSEPPPIFYDDRAQEAAADGASTPIQTGTTSVVVTVSVRWGID